MDDSLLETYFTVFRLFLLVTLVAFGVFFMKETPLKDITKAYTEIACTKGGLTDAEINAMKAELGRNGFEISKIQVVITPTKALNPTTTSYAKRGEIISLAVTYNNLPIIDGIFKKLGSIGDVKNKCIRYGMSEKY